jgi:ABC-2 type transport system permease protein
MDRRRTLALTRSDLKRTIREPSSLLLVIMFPIALTIIFGTCFGAGGGPSVAYKMGVVDMNAPGPDHHWSADLVDNLTATQVVTIIHYADNATAQAGLGQGKVQAVIVIPTDFGASCAALADAGANINTSLELYLDRGSMSAVQVLPPLIERAVVSTTGQGRASAGPISLSTVATADSSQVTPFDYMVPGLLSFASIFVIMVVAQSFALDRDKGLLRRLNTTPMTAGDFMAAQVLSKMVVAVVQMSIVFVLVVVLGFHSLATGPGLTFAFALVALFSLCNVGLGLITASVAKNPGQATMIAFAFIMPQMFLGTFMGGTMSSAAQSASHFVPASYVTDGLTSILLRGAEVSSATVVLDVGMIALFSACSLIAGVLLFSRYGNR